MPFEHQSIELSFADFDQRQLRRDKEAVEQHQRGDCEQLEQDRSDRFAGHVTDSPLRK